MPKVFVSQDLLKVKRDDNGQTVILAWGDPIEVLEFSDNRTRIRVLNRDAQPFEGTVRGKLPTQTNGVLKFALVDVQQGDAMVLETPEGKVLLIDGGDNKLFARYLARRYPGTSASKPLPVEAMVITHGDADHFLGLNEIVSSETDKRPEKRLFLHPKRVYHNGLVKGPSKLGPEKIFGRTVSADDGHSVVELEDDLTKVDPARLNVPFRRWVNSLRHWREHGKVEIRRLAFGDSDAFQFLADEGIRVEVYGPIVEKVKDGSKKVDGLPLLHEPPKTVELPGPGKPKRFSTAHTINGHSIVLRVHFGKVRLLLSGDLNQESMAALRAKVPSGGLEAEVVKVPHHGSADFDFLALRAMAPVVWLISSGDESSKKEYIHPRATLMGALGRASRGDTSLVFCTELAAFFAYRGKVMPTNAKNGQEFVGFERTSFGIIHVRTDGERVLVFTHSGKEEMKEAYRFTVDNQNQVKFAEVDKR